MAVQSKPRLTGQHLTERDREKIVSFLEADFSVPCIAQTLRVSKVTVYRIRKNLHIWAASEAPSFAVGRPRKLTLEMECCLLHWLKNESPKAYTDEMAYYIWMKFGLVVSRHLCSRTLKMWRWSRKGVKKRASERNQYLRNCWLIRLLDWTAEQLVFVDESAANERTKDRKQAWAPQGIRTEVSEPLKRSERWSVLPAYTIDGYMAYTIFHGGYTKELFNCFIQNEVLPRMCAFPGPRSVLVMDNASIHRNPELLRMCDERGVVLAYLPPYSPDFNPIEESFSMMKSWMKRNHEIGDIFIKEGRFPQFLELAISPLLAINGGGTAARLHFENARVNFE